MNILWLSTRLLHPLDDFERMRVYHMLYELNREHPVTYLTFDDGLATGDAASRASDYATSLVRVPAPTLPKGPLAAYRDYARNFASPLPYAVWQYRSPAMQREIEEILRDETIDIVICDSLASAVNVPEMMPVPTILFLHCIEAILWHRPVLLASNFLRKRYAQQQWYRVYAFERNQCRRFDQVIAVSPEDLAWFTVEYGVEHASQISAGVDTDFFRPSSDARIERGQLVVMGAMDCAPNEDAVVYFATEVLPRLRPLARDLELTIVGRNATSRVRALARHDSRIHIDETGDTCRYLDRAAVVVVPQRIGGGARREILEAMAMEKPIVATTVATDGMPLKHGEHLLVADTPDQFASAVARLLDEPELARALGRRAGSLARSGFTWSHVAARLAETCAEVISRVEGHLEAKLIR